MTSEQLLDRLKTLRPHDPEAIDAAVELVARRVEALPLVDSDNDETVGHWLTQKGQRALEDAANRRLRRAFPEPLTDTQNALLRKIADDGKNGIFWDILTGGKGECASAVD